NTVSTNLVTSYAYTEVGSRASVMMPNGTETTYAYDSVNRPTNVVNLATASSTVLSSYGYTLHATGRPTAAKEITRQEDDSYTTKNLTWNYDKMYRLTNETVSASVSSNSYSTAYSYDRVGNRKSKSGKENGASETNTYNYNANDQLTNEVSSVTGTMNYGYDA